MTKKMTRQFTFVLSDQDRKMLSELARADGRTASGWIRYHIREAHRLLQQREAK